MAADSDTPSPAGSGRAPPAISVVIPVHNCERYVAEAIESILDQTFGDFELIIVDDGSTDGTGAILDEYARTDERVRVIRHAEGQGEGAARNAGIAAAKAEHLAFTDADDLSEPERLELQKQYLDAHPEVGAVASSHILTDVDGDYLAARHVRYEGAELTDRMQRYCHLHHWSILFRTDVLRDIGGYRAGFAIATDYDMLLRLIERTSIGTLDHVVCRYRQVPSSMKYTGSEAMHESAAIARMFARQRAERGSDDYDEYVRAKKMPRFARTAKAPSLACYYYKLARMTLDCGACGAMLKCAWKGMLLNPLWLPMYVYLALAGTARLALQLTGTLDWFDRTFRGR